MTHFFNVVNGQALQKIRQRLYRAGISRTALKGLALRVRQALYRAGISRSALKGLVLKARQTFYRAGISRTNLKKLLGRDPVAIAPEVFSRPDGARQGAPYISVIIASHNRRDLLIELMKSLRRQAAKVDPIIEIVAIPNGCSDQSYEAVVDAFSLTATSVGGLTKGNRMSVGGGPKKPIVAYDIKEGGLSNARNAGMSVARGNIITFIDDDIRLFDGWLAAIIEGFNDDRVGVLGGKIELWLKDISEPASFSHYHRRLLGLNDWGDEQIEVDPFRVFGGNFAMRRRVAAAVGEFSNDFGRIGDNRLAGEEADYFLRARDQRFRFFYHPRMAVEHLVDASRITDDYLFRSARGVGMSRVRLIDRAHKMNSELALNLLGRLHKMRLDYEDEGDEAKRLENATQREDLLGQLISTLDHLYGGRSRAGSTDLLAHPSLRQDGYFDLEARSEKLRGHNRVLSAQVVDLSQHYSVSVVIVTHNDDRYLEQTLESVVSQSHHNLDVIVVDNASTDNSRTITERYARNDRRVRLVSLDENLGPSAARNRGIELASGDYIQFLDGDDFLLSDSIAVRVAALRMASFPDVAGAFCGSVAAHDVDVAGKSVKLKNMSRMVDFLSVGGDCPFPVHASLTKTSIVRKFGGFAEGVHQAEDWDLWTRILRHGYCYAPSGYSGVAYRQKLKRSLIKSAPITHSDNARQLFFAASEPMLEDAIVPDTPFVFRKPVHYYRDHLKFAEREFRHGVMDALNRNDGVRKIAARLPADIKDLFVRRVDMHQIATAAVARSHSNFGHFKPFIDFFGREVLNSIYASSVHIDIDDALDANAQRRADEFSVSREPIADVALYGNDTEVRLSSISDKTITTNGLTMISSSADGIEGIFETDTETEQRYVRIGFPDFQKKFATRFSITLQSDDFDVFEVSCWLGQHSTKASIKFNLRTGETEIDHPGRAFSRLDVAGEKVLIEGVFFGDKSIKGEGYNRIVVTPLSVEGETVSKRFALGINHISYSLRS